MDHFDIRTVPQCRGNLFGLQALDPRDVGRGVIRQPAGKLAPGRIDQRHDVAGLKLAGDSVMPIASRLRPCCLDRPAGAGVDRQPSARLGGEADPAFPRGDRLTLGDEERADVFAGQNLGQDSGRAGRWR